MKQQTGDNMHFNVYMNTIFLTVGPSGCGKTALVDALAKKITARFVFGLEQDAPNVQRLESDRIRAEILGHTISEKGHNMMSATGGHTFDILFARLEAASSYPINAPFIFVDTTGLSEEFRNRVIDVARKNHYRIEVLLFNYKNKDDIFRFAWNRHLTGRHFRRMNREVMPTIKRSRYNASHVIREHVDLENITVDMVDIQKATEHKTSKSEVYVVGDVHEDLGSFIDLMRRIGVGVSDDGRLETNGKNIVLAGDILDKGYNTKATIDFFHRNRDRISFVMGNHDKHARRVLTGEKDESTVPKFIRENFYTAMNVLRNDVELRKKYLELSSQFMPCHQGDWYIVTHVPCQNKYLGKVDNASVRNQEYIAVPQDLSEGNNLEYFMKPFQEEADRQHPWHVFGHMAFEKPFWQGNKIGIDTGAVHGNALTLVRLKCRDKPKFYSVPSSYPKDEGSLLRRVEREARKVDVEELTWEETRRLDRMMSGGVNYIAGTMSPPGSAKKVGKLETLETAFDFFRWNNIKSVCLQPKYMGSRCQVYLHISDGDKCYATMRSGYRIRKIDLSPIWAAMRERFSKWMQDNEFEMIILDGELMPWHALGGGLIDTRFRPIPMAIRNEATFLEETGLHDALHSLRSSLDVDAFEKDAQTMKKKDLSKKYGPQYETLKNFDVGMQELDTTFRERESMAFTFEKQMELYGRKGDLQYKPFAVLKGVRANGSEEFLLSKFDPHKHFTLVSTDDCIVVDLTDKDSQEAGLNFYRELTTEQGMEGVVVKPMVTEIPPGVAPYLKVRNEDYLTIIYGPDFRTEKRYSHLVEKKDVRRKSKLSVDEYHLGLRMLRVPIGELRDPKHNFREMVAQFMFELRSERSIDPRL